MLDMNNKVKIDDEGNKVLKTETDDDGNVTETDEYESEELTDEESEEKQLLPARIVTLLKGGADFAELATQYSDSYYAVKYPSGVFVLSSQQFISGEETASATIADLEVGEFTEALTVGDGEYTYIVKRVELLDKVYENDDYAELFSDYDSTVKYDKYDGVVDAYDSAVTENETALAKFTMEGTFLSKYVDYYYYYNNYSSTSSS
jgi:hypothetical protein